jgi:hypothetical protein
LATSPRAGHLELAERLIELQAYAEAEPHLKQVLAREPDHNTAMFDMAECYRHTNRAVEAVPLLLKLNTLRPSWRDYLAWHSLIEVYQETGNQIDAVAQARKLAQVAPNVQHQCLLARSLIEAGEHTEARQVVEKTIEAYRFNPRPGPNDRRWIGKARQLLKELH